MIPESEAKTGKLTFPESYRNELTTMRMVGIPTENIRMNERIGLWYIADIASIHYITPDHRRFYYLSLLEHQTFGDMAWHLLAYFDWKTASWIELTETWDDIQTTAEEMCLI